MKTTVTIREIGSATSSKEWEPLPQKLVTSTPETFLMASRMVKVNRYSEKAIPITVTTTKISFQVKVLLFLSRSLSMVERGKLQRII